MPWERREWPHPTWIRPGASRFGMAAPNTPKSLDYSQILSLSAAERAGNARAVLGTGKPWECQNWELGLGTFGNADLGTFGKDTWLSLGKSIPRGSRWSRDGDERLFPDPRGSQAPAGIFPEQFWDWDLSTSSALVPPGAGTIRSNPGVWEAPTGRSGRVRGVVTKNPVILL